MTVRRSDNITGVAVAILNLLPFDFRLVKGILWDWQWSPPFFGIFSLACWFFYRNAFLSMKLSNLSNVSACNNLLNTFLLLFGNKFEDEQTCEDEQKSHTIPLIWFSTYTTLSKNKFLNKTISAHIANSLYKNCKERSLCPSKCWWPLFILHT